MEDGNDGDREQALEDYRRQMDLIEAEAEAGQITRDMAAEAMRAARADYERACAGDDE